MGSTSSAQSTDSDAKNKEDDQPATGTNSGSALEDKRNEKIPLKLVLDRSGSAIGPAQYLAIFLWLGWHGFLPLLILSLPLIFYFSKILFTAIFIIIATSMMLSIDADKQPKWGLRLMHWVMHRVEEYFELRIYFQEGALEALRISSSFDKDRNLHKLDFLSAAANAAANAALAAGPKDGVTLNRGMDSGAAGAAGGAVVGSADDDGYEKVGLLSDTERDADEGKGALSSGETPKKFFYAIEPHDVLPVGIFAFTDHLGFFYPQRVIGGLSSACFAIPFMRNIFAFGGAQPADRAKIQRYLSNDRSIVVCPGGVQEVVYLSQSAEKECVLFLRNRRGMAALALQHRAPLVPVFCFNQRALYSFAVPPRDNVLVQAIGRKLGFLPMMFFGVFGLPLGPPKPKPLSLVVGRPVPLPPLGAVDQAHVADNVTASGKGVAVQPEGGGETNNSNNKSNDNNKEKGGVPKEVDEYLAQFVLAMERLFEENKAELGMADISLRIL